MPGISFSSRYPIDDKTVWSLRQMGQRTWVICGSKGRANVRRPFLNHFDLVWSEVLERLFADYIRRLPQISKAVRPEMNSEVSVWRSMTTARGWDAEAHVPLPQASWLPSEVGKSHNLLFEEVPRLWTLWGIWSDGGSDSAVRKSHLHTKSGPLLSDTSKSLFLRPQNGPAVRIPAKAGEAQVHGKSPARRHL